MENNKERRLNGGGRKETLEERRDEYEMIKIGSKSKRTRRLTIGSEKRE